MAPGARWVPLLVGCAAVTRGASVPCPGSDGSCAAAADDSTDEVAALQLVGTAGATRGEGHGGGHVAVASATRSASSTCTLYPGKRVVLLSANSQYADFLDNWLFHAAPWLSPATEQVVVVAEHKEVIPRLRKMSGAYGVHFDVWHDDTWAQATEDPSAKIKFRNNAWVSVVRHRPTLILKLLDAGCPVLYQDIDTAWLKPLFPALEAYGQHDMLVANDDIHHEGKVCTCLMYIQPTSASKALVKQYAELSKTAKNDQKAFFQALALDEGKAIDMVILPDNLFPNRRMFDENRHTAVSVHANWFKFMDEKLEYLKKNGFWHEPL